MLRRHMDESPFFRHYHELHQTAEDLEQQYRRAAEQIAKDDDDFCQFWDKLQKEKASMIMPSRIPEYPEPDWDEYQPCYTEEYCDEVFRKLSRIIPDVRNWHIDLENRLDQLNRDLLPDEINPIIARGYCDKCP